MHTIEPMTEQANNATGSIYGWNDILRNDAERRHAEAQRRDRENARVRISCKFPWAPYPDGEVAGETAYAKRERLMDALQNCAWPRQRAGFKFLGLEDGQAVILAKEGYVIYVHHLDVPLCEQQALVFAPHTTQEQRDDVLAFGKKLRVKHEFVANK